MRPTKPVAIAGAMLFALCVAPTAEAQPEPTPVKPEPTVEAHLPPAPATAIDGDGTYAVGADIVPGTYSSAGPVEEGACYWKRIGGGELLDNAMTKKPQVVRIAPTDTTFVTNDCQPWQMTSASPPPEASPGDILGQLGAFIGKGMLSGAPPG